MRSSILAFLLSCLLLVSFGSTANIPRSVSSQDMSKPENSDHRHSAPTSDMPQPDTVDNEVPGNPSTDIPQTVNRPSDTRADDYYTNLKNQVIKSAPRLKLSAAPANDAVKRWGIWPADITNQYELDETTTILKSLSTTEPEELHWTDGTLLCWQVSMNEATLAQVLRRSTIQTASLIAPGVYDSTVSLNSSHLAPSLKEANMVYSTQQNAAVELVALSQPSTVPNLGSLDSYVYENNAGRTSYIYHVEHGVAFEKYPQEFPNRAPQHLFTPHANAQPGGGLDPGVDNTPSWAKPFHSTCTADKALGQQYGSDKNAVLIAVVMTDLNDAEVLSACMEIYKDIQRHPERRKSSVITMSFGHYQPTMFMNVAKAIMGKIMDEMDVPIVISSGNYGNDDLDASVNKYPAAFAASDFPLIVVGSCDAAGRRSPFSKFGPQVTTHAVGQGITCFSNPDANPQTITASGTSYAAPLVAGQVANLLASSAIPIDMTPGQVARNMRDYLATDPAAGWERVPGVRVLWNGINPVPDPPASSSSTSSSTSANPTMSSSPAGPASANSTPGGAASAGSAPAGATSVNPTPAGSTSAKSTPAASTSRTTSGTTSTTKSGSSPLSPSPANTSSVSSSKVSATSAASTPATPTPLAPTPVTPVHKKMCAGVIGRKYVERDVLYTTIRESFCVDMRLNRQSSVNILYMEGTMAEVRMTHSRPEGSDFKFDHDECIHYMLELVDGCDTGPEGNPANYKGGGTLELTGKVYFGIVPQRQRQPAVNGLQGGCDDSWNARRVHLDYTIWGHGWESGDNGENFILFATRRDCMISGWKFEYGYGDEEHTDGSEWTATFNTPAAQQRCIKHAAQDAGAPDGFGCPGGIGKWGPDGLQNGTFPSGNMTGNMTTNLTARAYRAEI